MSETPAPDLRPPSMPAATEALVARMRAGDTDSRLLRLGTLINLRWMAVAGQGLAVLFVHFGLQLPVPVGLCFVAICASAWLNVGLRIRFPVGKRLPAGMATALLAWDILQLSALLYLTGGITNPFALFLIAPVLIAASALPVRLTALLGLLAAAAASLLTVWHAPLPWLPGEQAKISPLLIAGNWSAILVALSFTALYAQQVAQDARDLSRALAATELVLAREQHLSQLDGLAAAAAHELGTPLATIALIARELQRSAPADAPFADDVQILLEQAQRCRDILSKLRSLSEGDAGPLARSSLAELVDEVIAPLSPFGVAIRTAFDGEGAMPVCQRNPGLLYGLANLVENAVDFARSTVTITGRWTPAQVELQISDDGPGFAEDMLMRLGEPYVRGRSNERHVKRVGDVTDDGGLGLGFFIAKTLLERTGARLSVANGQAPETGARVRIAWPLPVFSRGQHSAVAPMANERGG